MKTSSKTLLVIFSLLTIVSLTACNFSKETNNKENTASLMESKGRDIQRIALTQKASQYITEIGLSKPYPDTNCIENLNLPKYVIGKTTLDILDPSSSGPGPSITGGLDCSKSYFYTNKIKTLYDLKSEYSYGIYAKLEQPNGNIDCSDLGTDKILTNKGLSTTNEPIKTEGSGLYCYAILIK